MDICKALEYIANKTEKQIVNEIVTTTINASEFIIWLQKQQLNEGITSEGLPTGVYSIRTEKIAKTIKTVKPKIAGRPYNFQWTGELFKLMYIDVTKDGDVLKIDIDSNSKSSSLIQARINKLLGLTKKNKHLLSEFLSDRITNNLNSKINNV